MKSAILFFSCHKPLSFLCFQTPLNELSPRRCRPVRTCCLSSFLSSCEIGESAFICTSPARRRKTQDQSNASKQSSSRKTRPKPRFGRPLLLACAELPQEVVLLARERAALQAAVRVVQEHLAADLRLLPQAAGGRVQLLLRSLHEKKRLLTHAQTTTTTITTTRRAGFAHPGCLHIDVNQQRSQLQLLAVAVSERNRAITWRDHAPSVH